MGSTEEDNAAQCLGEKITLRAGEATSLKSHKGFPHHCHDHHHYRHNDQVMATTRIRMTSGAGGFFR